MRHLGLDEQCSAELAAVHPLEKATWNLRSVANGLFPPLAWVAEADRTKGLVTLVHGPRVEVREHFFIEGVWDGPFRLGEFGTTDCVFGSGGLLTGDSIRFVPSAATTDSLFYDEDGEHLTVSNSLPLLLALIGDALDPRCLDYPKICESVMDGINAYLKEIPTKKGTVRRLMYRNLDVSRGKVSESEKRMPPRFTSFAEYRDYLRDRYAQIAGNARDAARTWPLQIVSTQSKGYDSTAVNTLARASGIDKVFTVSTAKSNRFKAHQEEANLPDDDGGEICATLGLPYIRLNRRAFAEGFHQEYLYYCALHHNQDANLMDIRKHLSTVSLLLTGVLGELWRPKADKVEWPCLNADLRRGGVEGYGMAEWRLVGGVIHLPLPYIGARCRADIVEITESSEMDPWRLGTAYDRPIPRRIAEEAGVPRRHFGQSKMGSVVIFAEPSIPYGTALRREFFAYLADEKIMARSKIWFWPVVRWWNSMLVAKSKQQFAAIYYMERVLSKLTRRDVQFPRLWSKLDGTLFCFCVNRTADTFRTHLKTLSEGPSICE